MKLQYKIALLITLLGIGITTIITIGVEIFSHKTITQTERINKKAFVEEVAQHMEAHLYEKISISRIISATPLIEKNLKKSNAYYNSINVKQRKKEIDSLNNKWMNSKNIDDPFIQLYLTNPIAQYFKVQQELLPGVFGEIFLTNKFGAMIASSGKLTTLAHAHKYWWRASYNDGKGKIFIDDRGFDESVQGYVLGIVIPIKTNGEIIGILKSNIKITGSLAKLTEDFQKSHQGKLQIARTNGDVIAEYNVAPLTTTITKDIIPFLKLRKSITSLSNDNSIIATTPIEITLGKGEYGFGGSKKSIDHTKGSRGNSWHVVLTDSIEKTVLLFHQRTLIIVIMLCFFVTFAVVIGILYGKIISNPIIRITEDVKDIANGNLDKKIEVLSNDEIGKLAKALNEMIEKLRMKK